MKKNTHPKYQQVLFVDSASGYKFLCGSTLQTEATEKFEGVEYPVCYLSISSASHPFFTGSKGLVDAEGRVEKFRKRFEKKKDASSQGDSSKQEKPAPEKKAAKPAEQKKAAPVKAAAAPAKAHEEKKAAPAKAAEEKKAAPAKAAKAAKK